MTIKQALKLKNKLVTELNELISNLHKNNSVYEGAERAYSSREILTEIYVKINKITSIKTLIHKANLPVHNLIFEMGELKSLVKNLKQLDCTNGVESNPYTRRSENLMVKSAEISVVERDFEVKNLERKIEEIQDILDHHNITTEIPDID